MAISKAVSHVSTFIQPNVSWDTKIWLKARGSYSSRKKKIEKIDT